jgi:hypothetical protein
LSHGSQKLYFAVWLTTLETHNKRNHRVHFNWPLHCTNMSFQRLSFKALFGSNVIHA